MKAIKIIAILFGIYVAIVVAFESMLGYTQPQNEGTLVLTVTNDDGEPHRRVLARIESGDRLYVAVNHWPRAWYGYLKDRPAVQVDNGDGERPATAVPVTDEAELARVDAARPLGLMFRILTGFPPRHFVRLDMAPAPNPESVPAG